MTSAKSNNSTPRLKAAFLEKGIPMLRQRLNQELVKILRSTDIREKMASEGVEAVGSTPQEYAAHIKAELASYARVVKAAGIKAD